MSTSDTVVPANGQPVMEQPVGQILSLARDKLRSRLDKIHDQGIASWSYDVFSDIFTSDSVFMKEIKREIPRKVTSYFAEAKDARREAAESAARESLEPFKHVGLARDDSIRLLRIDSADKKNLVHCSLHEFAPGDRPKYTALSYEWADVRPHSDSKRPDEDPGARNQRLRGLRLIVCNGKFAQVTKNLHAALIGLHGPLKGRYLWVDAVCINQSDPQEKAKQVNRMGEIYRQADFVFVWLGRKDVMRDLGHGCMHVWPPYPSDEGDVSIKYRGETYTSVEDFLRASFSTSDAMAWGVVTCVIHDGWFTRMWTLQEFMFARNYAFYYNGREISPDVLRNAMLWFQVAIKRFNLGMIGPTWAHFDTNMFLERERVQKGERLLDLETNALLSWPRFCSDSRDKVFALLSITDPESLRLPSNGDSKEAGYLTADYEKSTEEVYTSFALCLLHGKTGLNVLSLVSPTFMEQSATNYSGFTVDRDEGRKMKLPSWIPCFEDLLGPRPLHQKTKGAFHAATQASSAFHLSSNNQVLTVSALPCDTVETTVNLVASKPTGDFQRRKREDGAKHWQRGHEFDAGHFWRTIKGVLGERVGPQARYKPTRERRLTAIWRTLITDTWIDTHPAPSEVEDRFISWLAKHDDPDHVQNDLKLDSRPQPSDHFLFALSESLPTRKFFVTKKGYFGLGPVTAEKGDAVVLVAGAYVPYMFRAKAGLANAWTLMGETYVHGIMKGEGVADGAPFSMIDIH